MKPWVAPPGSRWEGHRHTGQTWSPYCRSHANLISRLGKGAAQRVMHAYINGFEDELARSGLGAFDVVYVLKLIGYGVPLCKFGITRFHRHGWRLAEHGAVHGAVEVLVYRQTTYAVEIEDELKRTFGSYGIGRSKELLRVVDAEAVADRARELLSLPFHALGYARTPLGVYVPEAKRYSTPRGTVQVFGQDDVPAKTRLAAP